MKTKTLSPELLHKMDAYWRAANYLSVCRIYLYDHPSPCRPPPDLHQAGAPAPAWLFPSHPGCFHARINCKRVSSLIFSFAMETSWKHFGNSLLSRHSPVEPQNERHSHFALKGDAGREM